MAKLIRIYAAEGLYQIALQYFVPMEQLDVVFRPLTNTDFAILNKWIVQLGWPTGRSDPEVEADPSGRLKYAVNVGAEDAKSGIFLGVVSYILSRPGYAYLALYVVHPEYRGMGVGKLLWDRAFAEIGDRNVGIHSYDMTQKYRSKGGFKVIGTSVFRYYVSEQELTFKIKGYVEANPPKKLTTFVDVISSEDKEKIIRFMQKTENRTERYAEDDFMLGYMNSPSQHTVMIVNESGEPEGWATICHMGDGVDKMSPLFAINDEICMQLLSELLIKYGRGSTMRVLVSVSSLKNFAHEFIKSTPTSHLIAEMHQSFTKYQEYSAGYLEHFYYL